MGLRVHYQNRKFRLRESRTILKWLNEVIEEEGSCTGDISFIFTDDEFLREINIKFLEHDYFTDVITFNTSDELGVLNGEIYISSERVRYNSGIYNATIKRETLRVMVHGILHLIGYNDKSDKERENMSLKEDYYLEKLYRNNGI